ncbi:MAG: hypothetical protein N2248_03730 [candidate division WOR-3 bacterium]|uniref:Uncharacterized protein n=1 Tax=candidate division WOR-3 bacterium TaxID=2052148 RepID=A0A7C1NDG6_UNCW3|nr:hypothetical protein [candidate division WOR-3 bacterium]
MSSDLIGTWLAATLTLAIFSFLYRDNPLYRAAEHVYVGISAGFAVIYAWAFDVYPMLVESFKVHLGAKNYFEAYILIIPALLGVAMLLRSIPKLTWISRWPISFTIGIGAGLGLIAAIQGYLLPQIFDTLRPLININNAIIYIGVITTLTYFYFSREHKGLTGTVARIGIIFIMVAFGASFGYTVMARVSLLIGRFYFLFHDWLPLIR